jgi:hypothetical protein
MRDPARERTIPVVIEILMAGALLAASCAAAAALAVHMARRRARARAQRVLDVLAGEACAALALDDRSRRSARAVARYGCACERVAAARTWREIEAAVAGDRLRLAAWDLAGRGAERLRELLPASAPARR